MANKRLPVLAPPEADFSEKQLDAAMNRELQKIRAIWRPGGLYVGARSIDTQWTLIVIFSDDVTDRAIVVESEEAFTFMNKVRGMGGENYDYGSTKDGVPLWGNEKVQ